MTYGELAQMGKERLLCAGIAEAEEDSWLLLSFAGDMDRGQYYLKREQEAPGRCELAYRKMIEKRTHRIPLQYITGQQEFMGISFAVNEHVLVPRQDTECLVEAALPYVRGKRALDMCTGSGCIAISLAILGKTAFCCGADLSEEALEVARQNGERLHADVAFLCSNLFEKIEGYYDVIVANPPYIPDGVMESLMPEVRRYEPAMALSGGKDGLFFYRQITAQAKEYLKAGGYLFYEIGHDQRKAVVEILEKEGYTGISCKKDYAQNDRVVFGRMEGHAAAME